LLEPTPVCLDSDQPNKLC